MSGSQLPLRERPRLDRGGGLRIPWRSGPGEPQSTSVALTGNAIFSDGFESGDTSAWSETGSEEDLRSAATGTTFIQYATYDALGNRTSLTYPSCTATECTGADDLPAPAHIATTVYNQGMVAEVSSSRSFSGEYSYHPNFQLSQLAYSNGVLGTFLEGPWAWAAPRG